MSTQTRSGGGGGGGGHSRNQKKSNASNSGGGGGSGSGHDSVSHAAAAGKKGNQDASKTDKPEKAQPKATTEQLRIAQITNSTTEDPQINEKVTLLLTMTQRSEEEVCCALNECDYDLEAAANFLIEELPQGAFAKYEKKRKNKAAATAEGAAGDGDWADGNGNADKREKSRNRSSNRGGGRGSTDSRGWRGRETRENERNQRESREPRAGGDRGEDRINDNYRGQRNGGGRNGPGGGGRGGGFVSRSGRGGGRMGGRGGGPRGDRGTGGPGYGPGRSGNANDDHHEVELWDNTIAQNAEKQQQAHDDAWGDWNNEEYEGSLKDSKVFTTSNLGTQTAASVVSAGAGNTTELAAPPGLEHHLVQQGSHLDDGPSSGPAAVTPPATLTGSAATPLLQYSAAVSNPPPQLQSQSQASTQSGSGSGAGTAASGGAGSTATSFVSAAPDTFSSAASAAATLVQQAQQQQQLQQQQQTTPIKPSATLSAEQSQYFNSLSSQGASPGSATVPPSSASYPQNPVAAYSQTSSSGNLSQYATYAHAFASGTAATTGEQGQQQPQVRRARVKLPPPSKIPASAVEMPGDNALNNIGYLDVQFGGLDFGTDDSFEALPEKISSGVGFDGQQQQADDYQSKSQPQQSALSSSLQSSQIGDALSAAGYASRSTTQQQQQQQGGSSAVNVGANALDQLTKSDPYGQTASAGSAYQNAYQSTGAAKGASGYPTAAPGFNSSSYANVQSSVASSYQQQGYGYQPSGVNAYQQQASTGQSGSGVGVTGGGGAATQNIPVGGSSSQNSTSGNASSAYLTSGYSTPQSAYQSSQSVYGNTGLSNSSGFASSASNASSQYANFSASAKLKDATTTSGGAHYDSVSTSSGVSSSSGSGTGNGATGAVSGQTGANQAAVSNNNVSGSSSASNVTTGGASGVQSQGGVSSAGGVAGGSVSGSASATNVGVSVNNNNNNSSSNAGSVGAAAAVAAAAAAQSAAGTTAAVLASLTSKNSSSSSSSGGSGSVATTTGSAGGGAGGVAGSVSGTGTGTGSGSVGASSAGGAGGSGGGSGSGSGSGSGLVPTNIQMQGYYDLNYPPASLGAGRDNLGSVAYSAMTDGRFARTDNNSSPVGNVSNTMSQQAGSSAPMLNVPYAYFYGGNVMPGSFQYGTPAIYPQQIQTANTASSGQFPKPSYSAGYGSTSYDTLSQTTQDYGKGGYSSNVNQQNKTQTVSNQSQAGTGSDLTSSMYGKGHVALNKVNSYDKQSFHSGTPPPFNMANTQTAGGTSAQPYGMYLPMPAAGHHNMIHQPIHQVESDLAPPQVVVGRGGREADNQVHVHATGTQVTFQQIWHNTTNNSNTGDTESPYPNSNPVLEQDQGAASREDNFDQNNVQNYVKDDVSGISFFAD
ncbi:protein lingerer isoform X4 [Drosophila ananassae]|uniref:protein lingerer isoform X4 n=1 Tax=Drosophila ananassae TaxID=7217 RepID=UPI0013A5CF46|nr:protein lingerer isoform X4 [Drosophila ananassae]